MEELESRIPTAKDSNMAKENMAQAPSQGLEGMEALIRQLKSEINSIISSSFDDNAQQILRLHNDIGQRFESLTQSLAQLTLNQERRFEDQHNSVLRRLQTIESILASAMGIHPEASRGALNSPVRLLKALGYLVSRI